MLSDLNAAKASKRPKGHDGTGYERKREKAWFVSYTAGLNWQSPRVMAPVLAREGWEPARLMLTRPKASTAALFVFLLEFASTALRTGQTSINLQITALSAALLPCIFFFSFVHSVLIL